MNIKKCKVGTLLCRLGRWAGEDLQKDMATLCSDARSQSKEEEGNMFHPVTTANDKLLWEVGDNQHNGIEIRNLKAFLLILMLLCSFFFCARSCTTCCCWPRCPAFPYLILLQNAHPGPAQASSQEGLGSPRHGQCLSRVRRGLCVQHRASPWGRGLWSGAPWQGCRLSPKGRAVHSIYVQDNCNQDPASAVVAALSLPNVKQYQ